MNLLGAILLISGGLAAGIMKACALTEADRTYSAMIQALSFINSEISSRRAPLDDILLRLKANCPRQISIFVSRLSDGLLKLDEQTFCAVWTSSAEDCLQSLSPQSVAAVAALGLSLGRYDADMQCAALERCMAELSSERDEMRLRLSANKRMYIGLGGAGGLILAIVLI